jgi:AcrR family transcriptional regulator
MAACEVAASGSVDGVTIRAVAARAGLSPGLVLFHYQVKDKLLLALLDWIIDSTLVPPTEGPGGEALSPVERFHRILQGEMRRWASDSSRIRILFEFWVRGATDDEIGRRLRSGLRRYRQAFLPIASEVVESDARRFRKVTVDGLASLAVSFIKGCAVQAIIDRDRFDISAYIKAAAAVMSEPSRMGLARAVR